MRVIKPQVGGGFGGKSVPLSHEIIIAPHRTAHRGLVRCD
ncbi:MAG: molybdopterin-dependent oxidoreductase [Flavobacteriales bacterium]|nr:molybdopterin-dependent oxidoreductase [Flavobacteriales bacterium]